MTVGATEFRWIDREPQLHNSGMGLVEQPLVSFVLIAFEQDRVVADAVHGALSQTYSPLEVILSDDCSSDRTYDIMRDLAAGYRGPHRVTVRQTRKNLGLIGHINDVMDIAQGELIVAAAGDDISLPRRVERICGEYLASDRRAHSMFSNAIWIDECGMRLNLLHRVPVSASLLTLANYSARLRPALVNGATHAWSRRCFDFFGPLHAEAMAEDLAIPFRSALLGEIRYIHEPLVLYRRNEDSRRAYGRDVGYREFRGKWLRSQNGLIGMYESRLRDIDLFASKSSEAGGCATEQIGDVTRKLLQRSRDRLERCVGDGSASISPLRWFKANAEPLRQFITLLLYHGYQDLYGIARSLRLLGREGER